MSYQFTLSDIGLRLIKAYEGYVPDGRRTRDGRKIIGYGRIADDTNETVTETAAEVMLKADLAGIESIINTHVHAALTQSQFDALCSLAHSIGPDAFLDSDILHAMNRGEVINAANGFDAWRLGNVDGQIYVVDALVRRRTAEKALFLRPTLRTVPAPHETLKAFQDKAQTREQVTPTPKPEAISAAPASIVTLYQKEQNAATNEKEVKVETLETEDVIDLTQRVEETPSVSDYQSPIAEAAAEVSERLDALMDDDTKPNIADWPDSMVIKEKPSFTVVEDSNPPQITKTSNGIVIDYLNEDDALRESIQDSEFSSADRYINPAKVSEKQNLWAYITMIIFGLTAAGGGLWASLKGAKSILGEMGPLISSGAVAVGVLLFLMGLYYFIKHIFSRS